MGQQIMENHPYSQFENTSNWTIIEQSISDLVLNNDIELFTPKEYVIGYICMQLENNITKCFPSPQDVE